MCTKQLSPISMASMRLWTQNWCYLTCYPTCEPCGLLTKAPTYRPSLEQVQGHAWSAESKRLPIPLHYKEAEAWQREQSEHKSHGANCLESLPPESHYHSDLRCQHHRFKRCHSLHPQQLCPLPHQTTGAGLSPAGREVSHASLK